MTEVTLSRFKALVFDCYGTLIDWETGIWEAGQPLIRANGRGDIDRSTFLGAFARAETAVQQATPGSPYPDILARTHRAIAAELSLASTGEGDRAFGASVRQWPAFPDSTDALRLLGTRFHLFVLSNVDRAGFAASAAKLGVAFDGVYTAEDIGSYKPDPGNFRYMLDRLRQDFGFGPDDVLHTAQSQHHDLVPARAQGLATAWIDRQRLSEGGDWGATAVVPDQQDPDFLFFSLGAMAEAVREIPGRRSLPA